VRAAKTRAGFKLNRACPKEDGQQDKEERRTDSRAGVLGLQTSV
jgi:hypothetical protein